MALPAWTIGHDPTRKIVCISCNNDIAAKFANDFRAVVGAPWFRLAFPTAVISNRKNTESETIFTAGGFRLGTSIGGGITGRGGDTVICDDPLKAQDANSEARRETANHTLQSTVISRLDDKKRGSIIVGMQRLHANDFVGSLTRNRDRDDTGHTQLHYSLVDGFGTSVSNLGTKAGMRNERAIGR